MRPRRITTLSGIRMGTKISISRGVLCAGVGMCVGFVYFVCTLLLAHRDWYHKIGDGTAVSQWLDAINMVIADFPFGNWVSDGRLTCLLSGLFWAALGSGLCAFRLWRKHSA